MDASELRRFWRSAILTCAAVAAFAFSPARPQDPQPQQPAPKPPPSNAVVIRGCLTGSKLTHVDPQTPALTLPGELKVTTDRVIRDQLKPLDGHQVELTGTLRGIPDQETGLLVVDSPTGKVYLGGADKRLGEDQVVSRSEKPTIQAKMIKDLAAMCTAPAK
jgi:hypothetical protein